MNRLHELQSLFRHALLENNAELITVHIQNNGAPVDHRLDIYRNNVFTNLREALRTLFPVIEKLVGNDFFSYMADEYIRHHPSSAGDLNQFGEHMATFLAEFEPVSKLPYLPDMAKLEWLAHRVYHATEQDGLAAERLGCIDPDHYGKLHFSLNPASALLQSCYPIHHIWQVNQTAYMGNDAVNLDSGGVNLLIERRNGIIELQSLSTGEWVFLSMLAADKDFSISCRQAQLAEPELDLSSTMVRLVTQSTLVNFRVHHEETNNGIPEQVY